SEHAVITGTVGAAGENVKMTGTGDFQTSPKLGSMHLSMNVTGKTFDMDEVLQGWTIYMKSPVFSAQLPAGKSWVSLDLQKAGQKLGLDFNKFTQQDPSDMLGALKKAGSLQKLGSETIDGVDTTHYHVTIDLAKAPNGPQLMKLTNLKSLPADVWIDGQDQLRRMKESYSVTTGGQTISTSMQMDLSNYGEQVNVQVPSSSETLDMTKLGG
ncbi:MAG TPA: LppX_LprAFG lipoprotein, partial [Gaiellaceae bacterium]|nr:LppX_LprAFG lipoprotein [Gaiellaceae bacterium]